MLVQLLVQAGAAHEKYNLAGCTPLLYAIELRSHDIALELLNFEYADIENRSSEGHTSLALTFRPQRNETPDLRLIKRLLEKGADMQKVQFDNNQTHLCYAAQLGDLDVAMFLLEMGSEIADVNEVTFEGQTPLLFAIKGFQRKSVWFLLDQGADARKVDSHGVSPLVCAIENMRVDTMRLLLENLNEADVNQQRHLMIAAMTTRWSQVVAKVCELLLSKGAYVDAVDDIHGRTALSFASGCFNHEAVPILLENGANVNSVDNCGQTPLMHASKKIERDISTATEFNIDDCSRVIRSLVENGADLSTLDASGLSVASITRKLNKQLRRREKKIINHILERLRRLPLRTLPTLISDIKASIATPPLPQAKIENITAVTSPDPPGENSGEGTSDTTRSLDTVNSVLRPYVARKNLAGSE